MGKRMENVLQEVANFISKNENRVIIGISGHGASGKTTFATKLLKMLEPNDVNYLNTDPYIIGSDLRMYSSINYEYNSENHHSKMTACHPAAHNILALQRDVTMIKDGLDFYTIDTHYKNSTLISSQYIGNIVEGMSVAFVNPDLFDLKIYLYTDGETEFQRRSVRDVSERGTSLNYLRESHEERRIQYELFMHPYHQNFDVVIKSINGEYVLEKREYKSF